MILRVAQGAGDSAGDIVGARPAGALADADLTTELEAMVRKSARVGFWTLPTLLFGLALGTAIYVGAFPVPSARRQATFYLKRRAGQFFYLLWRVTARGGELNASVSDPAL